MRSTECDAARKSACATSCCWLRWPGWRVPAGGWRTLFTTRDGLPLSNDVISVAVVKWTGLRQDHIGIARFSAADGREMLRSFPTQELRSRPIPRPMGCPMTDHFHRRGRDGVIWLATPRRHSLRRKTGAYRQGLRWLPDDDVRAIAVERMATLGFRDQERRGLIERRRITAGRESEFFEDEIDLRHRRTPYGYVLGVRLNGLGDKSEWDTADSDNDGFGHPCMALASWFRECGDRERVWAKKRAKAAFRGTPILESCDGGWQPSGAARIRCAEHSAHQRSRSQQHRYARARRNGSVLMKNRLWKVLIAALARSADGQWYWKTDTVG